MSSETTRVVQAIHSVIEQKTDSGANIDYRYGIVDFIDADSGMAALFLDGDFDSSLENFRVPGGLYVEAGDAVLAAVDKRGHQWIVESLPDTAFSKLAIDPVRGRILIGTGDLEPDQEYQSSSAPDLFPTYYTLNTLTTYNGQWTRIGYVTLDAKYGSLSATVLLGGNGAWDTTWTRGLLRFRLRQSDDFGNDPVGMIELNLSGGVSPSDFVFVVTDKTGPVQVDLYARVTGTYQWLEYMPLEVSPDRASVFWTQCEDFVPSLPAGTQIVAVAGAASGTIKVSATDTTSNFLQPKLVAGSNITITKQNSGANETLSIASSSGGSTTSFSGAKLERTTDLSVATNTNTLVPFPSGATTVRYDTDSFYSSAQNTRLTAPRTGKYIVGASIRFEPNATSVRGVWFRKTFANATTEDFGYQRIMTVTGSLSNYMTTASAISLAAGEYVQLLVEQSSGGALNLVAEAGLSNVFWIQDSAGATGPQGATGAAGQGVPTGGTTGQSLVKLSATNYDTGWSTPSGGSGTTRAFSFFSS